MIRRFTVLLFALLLMGGAYGQGSKQAGKYGNDSLSCVKHTQLYNDFYQQKKYAEALQSWRWTIQHCPGSSENIYIDGAVLLDEMIRIEKDSLRREQLTDTLLWIYDKRIEHFGNEGIIIGRKGVERFQRRPWQYEQAYNELKKSYSIKWVASRPAIMVNYFLSALEMLDHRKLDTVSVYKLYNDISKSLRQNIKKPGQDSALFKEALGVVKESFSEVSPCDKMEDYYLLQYLQDSSNTENIRKAVAEFEKAGCTYSRLYWYLLEKTFNFDSSDLNALSIGQKLYEVDLPFAARKYLSYAVESKDRHISMEALLLIGKISFTAYYFHRKAIYYAKRAIALDSTEGRAYLLLGDVYCSASEANSMNKFEQGAVYWVAVDQYEKALRLDPKVKTLAEEKIKANSLFFPTRAMIDEQKLKEGDPYRVEYWIHEDTHVRSRP